MACEKFFPWMNRILIFSTISTAFMLAILNVFYNEIIWDNGYLGWNMDFNWNMNYISNIDFQKTKCLDGFITLQLGYWTGFPNGVLLKNTLTGETVFSETMTKCSEVQDVPSTTTCEEVKEAKPLSIDKYKGYYICVKYGEKDFVRIWNKIQEQVGTLNYDSNDVSKISTPILDSSAILDIAFVNKTEAPMDVKKYSTDKYREFKLYKDYSVYVYFEGPNLIANKYIDKVLVDIKLSNEYWCGCSDLANPQIDTSMISKNSISYGYYHCDFMAWKNRAFYPDNYVRTFRLCKDSSSLSKRDFYGDNILAELNKIKSAKWIETTKYIDNTLVGVRHFSGLGCSSINDPKKFILNYTQFDTLWKLSIAFLSFITILVLLSLGYQCCYFKGNNRALIMLTIVMKIFSVLATICAIVHLGISRECFDNISEYILDCKDRLKSKFLLTQEPTTMELEYLGGLKDTRLGSGLVSLTMVANFGFLVIHLLSRSCWANDDESENNENVRNEQELQHVEPQEFDKVPSRNDDKI